MTDSFQDDTALTTLGWSFRLASKPSSDSESESESVSSACGISMLLAVTVSFESLSSAGPKLYSMICGQSVVHPQRGRILTSLTVRASLTEQGFAGKEAFGKQMERLAGRGKFKDYIAEVRIVKKRAVSVDELK